MYVGFRPLPSELPCLHKRSAPRFLLVRLKQESRISKIIDRISPPSSRLKRFWTTDEKRTQKITRSLDKTKICPVTNPCFYKDGSHFRKFQWDLQYFPCDLRYVTEMKTRMTCWGFRSRVTWINCNRQIPKETHSRPQRPRSFWSAPRIETSGRDRSRKSENHRLPAFVRSLRNLNNNGYYRLQKRAAIALAHYLAPARGLDPWRRPKGSWALGTRMKETDHPEMRRTYAQ